MNYVSPQLEAAAASNRSEADVRARRAILEASLRQEGVPESMIARLATDDTAVKMLDYEHKTMAFIANLFGGR